MCLLYTGTFTCHLYVIGLFRKSLCVRALHESCITGVCFRSIVFQHSLSAREHTKNITHTYKKSKALRSLSFTHMLLEFLGPFHLFSVTTNNIKTTDAYHYLSTTQFFPPCLSSAQHLHLTLPKGLHHTRPADVRSSPAILYNIKLACYQAKRL